MKRASIWIITAALIGGCANSQEQPPETPHTPTTEVASIKSVITSSFDPATRPFLYGLNYVLVDSLPIPPDQPTQDEPEGMYHHPTQTISVKPGVTEGTLLHEMLHPFWMHGMVPQQEEFARSIELASAHKDDIYEPFADLLIEIIAVVHRSYSEEHLLDEVWAYLGGVAACEHDFPFPEEMLRHYRGVLAPAIISRRDSANFEIIAPRDDGK